MDYSGNGLVTIITVVLNEKEKLEKTIQSIISQAYKNIEYIIIDGGSTDGTLEVIRKYQQAIHLWISEPDKGIYDAMNKGICLANGDWVSFMNAGDIFCNSNSISSLIIYFRDDTALIYGDVRIAYNDFERTQCAEPFSRLLRGMVCSHQSVLMKKQILERFMFNPEYSLAADYDLLSRLYQGGYKATKVDITISKVINGGKADVRRIEVLRQYQRIALRIFKRGAMLIYVRYKTLILLEKIKIYIKKIFSQQVVCLITRLKYREGKK